MRDSGWISGFARRAGLIALAVIAWTGPSSAAETVRVGAYYFPPFVDDVGSWGDHGNAPRGVTAGFLRLLNDSQTEFRFVPVRTTPTGRFADFDAGRFDAVAFEQISWGWHGRPVAATRPFFDDAEVYVAEARPGRGQGYFDSLAGKRIAAIRGYHYGFAGFDADPARLAARFAIHLGDDHEANIARVLAGTSDVAVVTRSWLDRELARRADWRAKLLISKRVDQTYHLSIVVRDGKPPGVARLDTLLDRLRASGALEALWRRYHLH